MASKTASEPFLTLGFAGIDWIEHYLVHGPGDVQGQSIELDDEFAAFIVKGYQVDAKGDRKVRRAFLSRSKGRSKSGLAAMIACFEALGPCRFDHFAEDGEVSPWGYEYEPGEPVGRPLAYVEILNVATEEGQAGNTYDAIYYMLNPDTCSDELLADYGKIDVGITRTNLPDKRGFIEPVTSADSSKDGGKSTFIVADETHLWILPRLKRLHGIMTRNLLKRKIASGWMLETSTMYGAGEQSVAEGTHEYAKDHKRDGTLLFDHRQASLKWDLSKRPERMQALLEAYGPAAEWMNLDAICDSWDDPQVSEAEFRRYWLNQPVPTVVPEPGAIDLKRWAGLAAPDYAPDPVENPPTGFAIDTGIDRSWSAISAAAPFCTCVPPLGACGMSSRFVDVLEHGVGTSWVVASARRLSEKYPRVPFAVDKGGPAGSLIPALKAAGVEVVEMGSTDVARSYGLFMDAVTNGSVRHSDAPPLNAAVAVCKTRPCGSDGGQAFGRKVSGADITALTSGSFAHWASLTVPDMAPEVWSLADMVAELRAEQEAQAKTTGGADRA